MRVWFFFRKLPIGERKPGERFEVQLLDDDGRAVAVAGYDAETALALGDVIVPAAVLDAGRERPEGSGTYVDHEGVETPPF
jgi:hypothetical protein